MNNIDSVYDKIKSEFDETVNDIMNIYDKSLDDANLIVSEVIINVLKRLQIDTKELGFIDFYRRHIHNLEVLYYSDFTVTQLEHIINEAPISDEDKKIARKLYIEAKTYSTTAGECFVAEPKTIASKKDKISGSLKKSAIRLSKIQTN